jgi:hypothetical protein
MLMNELKVIGVEDGALVVASDEGSRYRVEVDDVIQARLRQSSHETGTARKLAPREVQAHIRAGMSAEDVAAVTGASLEYIQRFEGPVLAEREFVIESALNVPVQVAVETDPAEGGATFGSVIRQRLADAGAINERWASWKEQGGGWIVKLTFTAAQVDHDARWGFEPRKSALSPINPEAVSLSQQGELPPSLIPRLRAVTPAPGDTGRFDSGAFEVADQHEEPAAPVPISRFAPGDAVEPPAHQQTADLLEALRRRRGERDPMDPGPADSMAAHPSTGAIRLIDIPMPEERSPESSSPGASTSGSPDAVHGASPQPRNATTGPLGKRRGRASMPTWDEIVFGARPDDDLG